MAKEDAHPHNFPQCGLCDKHSEIGREGEWNFRGGKEAKQVALVEKNVFAAVFVYSQQ